MVDHCRPTESKSKMRQYGVRFQEGFPDHLPRPARPATLSPFLMERKRYMTMARVVSHLLHSCIYSHVRFPPSCTTNHLVITRVELASPKVQSTQATDLMSNIDAMIEGHFSQISGWYSVNTPAAVSEWSRKVRSPYL